MKTTEAQRESARSLEQPEELTTLAQESVKATSEIPATSEVASTSSEVPLTSSEVPLSSSEAPATTELPATPTEASTTKAQESEVKVVIQEVFTKPPSEVATVLPVTEEPKSTEAPPTFASNPELAAPPTEFEKLLTTLREFVALVDASTSTEAPKPLEAVPQLDKIVEFVNYTVSSEKEKVNEEPKSISKRSVPDADLIPRYFKQHYSLNKEKSCNFNGRSFKVGEVIKTDNDCLKCSCAYAPIGHCMLKEKCNF